MTYKLKFVPTALKEWGKLGETVKKEFKAVLEKRLESLDLLKIKGRLSTRLNGILKSFR